MTKQPADNKWSTKLNNEKYKKSEFSILFCDNHANLLKSDRNFREFREIS